MLRVEMTIKTKLEMRMQISLNSIRKITGMHTMYEIQGTISIKK